MFEFKASQRSGWTSSFHSPPPLPNGGKGRRELGTHPDRVGSHHTARTHRRGGLSIKKRLPTGLQPQARLDPPPPPHNSLLSRGGRGFIPRTALPVGNRPTPRTTHAATLSSFPGRPERSTGRRGASVLRKALSAAGQGPPLAPFLIKTVVKRN